MNNELKQDLDKLFSSYSVVELSNEVIREKSIAGETINISSAFGTFSFTLERRHLRPDKLKLEIVTEEGQVPFEREEGVTFNGKLIGDSSSEVRFMIDDKNLNGFISSGDNKFFFTSASYHSVHATPDEVVIYRSESVIAKPIKMQDALTIKGLEHIKDSLDPKIAAVNQLRIIEIATDADYALVNQLGGVSEANNWILSVINIIEGIFKAELGLMFSVTHQNAWAVQDPYTPNNGGDLSPLLMSFQSYWNVNKPFASYPRDATHLFTGRWQGAGLAFVGAMCTMPSFAYGVSAYCGSASIQALVTGHELGHNLGADHEDGGECYNSMMNAMLYPSVTSFCQPSRNTIASFVAQYGNCLAVKESSVEPTPAPYVPPVEPKPYVPPVVEPLPPVFEPPTPLPPVIETPTPAPYVPPVEHPTPEPYVPPVETPTPDPYVPPTRQPEPTPVPPVETPTPVPPVEHPTSEPYIPPASDPVPYTPPTRQPEPTPMPPAEPESYTQPTRDPAPYEPPAIDRNPYITPTREPQPSPELVKPTRKRGRWRRVFLNILKKIKLI